LVVDPCGRLLQLGLAAGPCSRPLKNSFVRNAIRAPALCRGLPVLSDIVKRRSIRAPQMASAMRGAPSPCICRDASRGRCKCRRSLTASSSVRSYEANWSF